MLSYNLNVIDLITFDSIKRTEKIFLHTIFGLKKTTAAAAVKKKFHPVFFPKLLIIIINYNEQYIRVCSEYNEYNQLEKP